MRHNAGFSMAVLRGAPLALAAALSGCTSMALQDAAPASVPAEPAVFARPGDYPNLNVVPTPAAEQLTRDEASAVAAELRARRERLAAGQGVRDRSAELSRLGRSHADDALRRIEAQ